MKLLNHQGEVQPFTHAASILRRAASEFRIVPGPARLSCRRHVSWLTSDRDRHASGTSVPAARRPVAKKSGHDLAVDLDAERVR